MATSSTNAFNLDFYVDEIIEEAFELAGGQPQTGYDQCRTADVACRESGKRRSVELNHPEPDSVSQASGQMW